MQRKSNKTSKCLWAGVSAFILAFAQADAATYPAPDYAGPASNPGFPGTFAAFNPPVATVAIHPDAPQISEWIRSNQPGDTMILTGEKLSALSGSSVGQDTRFVLVGQSGGTVVEATAVIDRQDGFRVAAKLPSTLPAKVMYLMWPANANGYGKPAAINATEPWWIGPQAKLTRGNSFSIFGRNLVADDAAPVSHAWIQETGTWLTSTAANPYKADFTVPASLANGTYTLWAHNGQGRQYGWGRPLKITVDNGFVWNDTQSTWINVKNAPYNAKGDGSSDDYAAISAALSACPSGGTVYLPAGTYRVGQSFWNMGGSKRILGAGMDATTIKRHATFNPANGQYIVINNLSGSEIKNLTLDTGGGYNGKLTNNRGSRDVRFTNVRFTQAEWLGSVEEFVDIHECENILYRGCKFITSSGLFLGNAKQIFFENCDFYGIRDCNGMVYEKSGRDISFVNCTAQPLDSSDSTKGYGWSKGRWIVGSGGWGGMRNFYFGGNRTTDMIPRQPVGEYVDQNSGEQFLFEGLYTTYRGQPVSVGSLTVRFGNLSTTRVGNMVSIVGGRGIGQTRAITAFDAASKTITLDEPWRVAPDTGSMLAIGEYMARMAVYGNQFDGMPRATSPVAADYTASAGVSAYGGCSDLVVDNNTFHELRTAIFNWGNGEPTASGSANIVMQPNYFNLFVNNQISVCLNAIVNTAYIDKPSMAVEQDTVILGNVFRKNRIDNVTKSGITVAVTSDKLRLDMCVYDQNSITSAVTEVILSPLAMNQVMIEASDVPPPPDPPPAPVLSSIAISGSAQVNEGATATYVCTATYSDASTANVAAVWSENSTYASITSAGVLSAAAVSSDQSVTVAATFGGKSATFAVTIKNVPPVLSSIRIIGPSSINEQTVMQYACEALYSDGSVVSVAPVWSEASPHASINSAGLLTAGNVTADQNVAILANYQGQTASLTVTVRYVPPVLTGVAIVGASALNEGSSAQYTCVGTYSDSTTAAVSPAWSVDPLGVAAISAAGLLSAGNVSADQTVTVVASIQGFVATQPVLVRYVAPTLTSIEIGGATALDEQTSGQYTCTAHYSDGGSQAILPDWSVDVAALLATINAAGVLQAGNVLADQVVNVLATYGGKSDSYPVAIRHVAAALVSIEVSGPGYVDAGSSAQYACTAYYDDSTSQLVAPVWSVDKSFATINSLGLLQAESVAADSSLSVSASYGGVSDAHAVVVKYVAPPVVLTGISIVGPSAVNENSTAGFTCTAHYSNGSSETVVPVWSDNSAIATIAANGTLSLGNIDQDATVVLTATYQGMADTHSVDALAVGTQVVYPLQGFSGKLIKARLWNQTAGTWHDLGEMLGPPELVIENVDPDQWYWISVEEYDGTADAFVPVHANWLNM